MEKALANSSAIDKKKLCIEPGEQGLAWKLYIDALVLGTDGNVLDCLSLGVKAALFNLQIPRIDSFFSVNLDAIDFNVSSDPKDCDFLNVTNVPVFVTMSKIGSSFVLDASEMEQQCS